MKFQKSRQNSIILHVTILTSLVTIVFPVQFRPGIIPIELQTTDIISKIITDPDATSSFATDFGNFTPGAVFYPSSPNDIATLIRISYMSSKPFTISPRGVGHSIDGQTFAPNGIVVDMPLIGRGHVECRINVTNGPVSYADVGGEQHWINVLNSTLRHGLSPQVFTDYLYPTVGGTLSNAGLGGQAFRHGPQISNVYELDVITGQVILSEAQVPGTKSSFFSKSDIEKITRLASKKRGPLYLLEGGVYYNDATVTSMDEKLKMLLEELQYAPGFAFIRDVPFVDFLDRVHHEENYLRSLGLWWEDEMSVVIPDEEMFYIVSFLWSAASNDLEILQNKNKEVLLLCEKNKLGCKQYLPHYTNQADWQKHFGKKWCKFASKKQKFDPKALLSPGHQIFTPIEATSTEQNQISSLCTSGGSFCHQGNWIDQFYSSA
ncbi:hypothetical protein LUZ61_015681 [Rhynchospora tenuis]|uniref:FAD-binding PCMH-type domain-containing protein n=1 Tax=Rhynchospora tenuis TaxID=198213 RepID=A0AAD5Z428_9POAL|nr:hypothetical protein LUZ61_015681 [Rhynchospora tenuis]